MAGKDRFWHFGFSGLSVEKSVLLTIPVHQNVKIETIARIGKAFPILSIAIFKMINMAINNTTHRLRRINLSQSFGKFEMAVVTISVA